MKKARGDETIKAIPDGVYEGGIINQELKENKNNKLNDKSTDSQGNGYPTTSKNEAVNKDSK